jgi:putative oxidoreductase
VAAELRKLPLPPYPFVSLPTALLLLRVGIAILFMAHATVRVVIDTIPQFVIFMERQGFTPGVAWVWAITLCELIGGSLMALGYWVRTAATGLFTIAAVGIVLIHRHFGWFVGEHGTGGSEYSIALMLALLVIAAAATPTGAKRLAS